MWCEICNEETDILDVYEGPDGKLLCYACYKEAEYIEDELSERDSDE